MRALDDCVGERGQGGDDQRLAHRIDAPRSLSLGLGHVPRGEQDGHQPDGQVDEEHRTPAEGVHQRATQDRTQGNA